MTVLKSMQLKYMTRVVVSSPKKLGGFLVFLNLYRGDHEQIAQK